MSRYSALSKIENDAFLAGPDRVEAYEAGEIDELLDIDPIFGKTIERILEEFREFDPNGILPAGEPLTPSDIIDGYSFQEVSAGLLLLDPEGNVVGGYLGSDLAVSGEHQGKGLGAELVLETYLRSESIPVWHLDTASYSPAGEAAHISAWSLLQNEELCERKLARIDVLDDTPKPGV